MTPYLSLNNNNNILSDKQTTELGIIWDYLVRILVLTCFGAVWMRVSVAEGLSVPSFAEE